MGVKDSFTAEEWKSLLRAPMLAGYAVAEGERAAKDSLLGAVVADIIADAEDGSGRGARV